MIDSRETSADTPQEHLEAIERLLARHYMLADLAQRQVEHGAAGSADDGRVQRENMADLQARLDEYAVPEK